MAEFWLLKQTSRAVSRQSRGRGEFLNMIGIGSEFFNQNDQMNVEVTEIKSLGTTDTCNISLTSAGESN